MRRIAAVAIILVLLMGGRLEAAPTTCKPVPIEEAVRIGHEYARKWRPEVELLRVDTAHPPSEWEAATTPPGLDGRRCVWNFEVKDPQTNQLIMFRVANGSVTDFIPDAGMDTGKGFPPAALRVTGKELARKAREAGILPARPPGTAGYSYYLSDRGNGRFEVQVVGEDAKGGLASIRVDPSTGVILVEEATQSTSVWVKTDRVEALERVLIAALEPQVKAALAGVYGSAPQFDQVRITRVEQHKVHSRVLRVVLEVETFWGAHNPLGIDTLEFLLEPSSLRLAEVRHRQHPQYRRSGR